MSTNGIIWSKGTAISMSCFINFARMSSRTTYSNPASPRRACFLRPSNSRFLKQGWSVSRRVDKETVVPQDHGMYSVLKEMSSQAMKRHRGNLNTHDSMKETNLRSQHTVWLQWCDVLEKAELGRQLVKGSVVEEGRMKMWSPEDFCGSDPTLDETITEDTCHYKLVRTGRRFNVKSEASCKPQTWDDNDVSV